MNIIILITNVILYVILVIITVEVCNGIGALIITYFSIIELITSFGLFGEVINDIQQTNSNRAYVINALYSVAIEKKRASRRKTRQNHRSSVRAVRAHRRSIKKARRLNRR